jgi:hypothetical protein
MTGQKQRTSFEHFFTDTPSSEVIGQKQRTSFEHFFTEPAPSVLPSADRQGPVTELAAKTIAAGLLHEANKLQLAGVLEKTPSPETLARAKGFREAADWILAKGQIDGFNMRSSQEKTGLEPPRCFPAKKINQ